MPDIWKRRQKGGRRRVTRIPVRVIGETPVGTIVVERERRYRTLRETVAARNVERGAA